MFFHLSSHQRDTTLSSFSNEFLKRCVDQENFRNSVAVAIVTVTVTVLGHSLCLPGDLVAQCTKHHCSSFPWLYVRVRLVPFQFQQLSLGNRRLKDRQQFVHAIVLIFGPDWSESLSNCENVVRTPFEIRWPSKVEQC